MEKGLTETAEEGCLIFGEAGMGNTAQIQLFLSHADRTGAAVILIGDDKQMSAIGAGGPFSRISKTVPTAHLSENFRQRNAPEDAQAAADLRAGDATSMLESYARRGRLKVCATRDEAAKSLVKEWAADGNCKNPDDALVLSQTREEARILNRLCQRERLIEGRLSPHSVTVHGTKYHVGDRVMFHEPMRRDGIENGYQGTVVGFNKLTRSLQVKLDRVSGSRVASRPVKQIVNLRVGQMKKEFLTLGYAATTSKMQGQSRKNVYCLAGGSHTDQRLAYVQVTRGEELTKLFTDRHHAGPKLTDLAEAFSKSTNNELAHERDIDLRLRIERPGGR